MAPLTPFLLCASPLHTLRQKRTAAGSSASPDHRELHILGKKPHRSLQILAKKYGPIMFLRFGSVPTIVVSSPEAVELFLKTHDHVFANRPKIQAFEYMFYGSKGFAFSPYGPHWRSIKKLSVVHLLNPERVESYGEMRKEAVGKLVEFVKKAAAAGEVVDLSAKLRELIEDMSCQMILGCRTRDRFNLQSIVREALSLAGAFNLADYVPLLGNLDLQGLTPRMKAVRAEIDKALEDIIDEHERNSTSAGSGKEDFVDILLSLANSSISPGDELMDRTNIKAILFDMVTASYESPAVMVEWALVELMRNPWVMRRLQEELDTIIGMDKMVEEADLPKLSYIEMVVKESTRLHPVASLLVPHSSREDTVLGEFRIPKGSHIFINTWAIGRDPRVWSDNVEEFFPERFIGDDVNIKGQDFRLTPFGSGRRGCPGKLVALREGELVLAQLVHCFNWELPVGMLPCDLDMTEDPGLSNPRADRLLLRPITYRLRD